MSGVEPLVSVVIATVGRAHLVPRAVRSALDQDVSPIEVLVVIDGPDDATSRALARIQDRRLRVLGLPDRRGLGGARNAGVGEARGAWVALLDDDDEWLPGKLALQLDTARRSRRRNVIVSCRFIARGPHGDVVLPRRCPRPGEALSEYLFCQTRLLGGEGVVLPSTILTTKELLERTPFRYARLPHEGSDWLLRAIQHEGAGVEFVPADAPLVIWHAEGMHGRMSDASDWQGSLAWAEDNAHLLTPRAHASFLLIRASLEARRAKHWGAFWTLLREAFRRGRPTLVGILAHASIWLVPQRARFSLGALLTPWLPSWSGRASIAAASSRARALAGGEASTESTRSVALSVIVASYNAETTIRRCLRSLEAQDTAEPYEVIVVDSSIDDTADLVAREFPNVRLFTSASRLFPGDARNVGVAQADGAIIAFTDADCVVDRAWVQRVLDAHRNTRHPIIGGAVDNGNPESWVGWASYFCEFTAWMSRAASGEMVEIPTTCLTLKRWLFDAYGPFLEATYCSDTAFNWKVGKNGYKPLFSPALRVSHINVTRAGTLLRRKAFHGKCFARVRIAEQRFSPPRRLAYALLSPLLPPILFARIARRIARERAYVREFALASPLVFCGLAAWAWGELLGYLSGPYSHPARRHG